MTPKDGEDPAAAVVDPMTDAATLARIAYEHPELGSQIARHPHAYPELVAWIAAYAAPLAAATPTPSPATEMAPTVDATTSHGAARRRRDRPLIVALACIAALAVVAAVGTTALAALRLTEHGPAATASSPDDAREGPAAGADNPTLPDTDTASGASELAASADGSPTGPIVLILDASGSMVRETTPGRTRMDDARDAMVSAIGALPDDSDVGLIAFGTGTGNSDAERAQGCLDVTTLHEVGALDRTAMKASVQNITASGFTPLGPSLRSAAAMLPTEGPATVILVSDGVDTCAPPAACEVASELRGIDPDLTIHAVGFAIDDDEEAQQQLQCIGRVGGGGYVSATNVHQLGARVAAAARGSDPESVLSTAGFHGVRLGMTLDEVRARTGSQQISDRKTVDGVEYVYLDCGWGVVELRGGLVVSITPDGEAATLDGLAVGDSATRLVKLYGQPQSEGTDAAGAFGIYPVSAGGIDGYKVYASESKVTRIVLCRCAILAGAGEYSTWEVTYDGVGPIRLGMTVAEVTALLPGSVAVEGETTARTWVPLRDQPWLRLEIVEDTVVKVSVSTAAEPTGIAPAGSTLPHMRGIRTGDTMTTARNIVPGGTVFRLGVENYVVATRTGTAIVFQGNLGDDGRIAGVSVVRATAAPLYHESPAVIDTSVFPAETQGRWCSRTDDVCFEVREILREHPNAYAEDPDRMPFSTTAPTSFIICLDPETMLSGRRGCVTATTMYFTYYPAGVDTPSCAERIADGWPGCEREADHDLAVPRLVREPNHQHAENYVYGDVLYQVDP